MHYTKIHWGDYSRDTSHLNALEHGLYFLMMRLYYTTESPLTLDSTELARKLGARDSAGAVDAVLADFFVKGPDGWHHKRIDAELAKYRQKSIANTEIGKLGGRPKKPINNRNETETVSNHNPQETLTTNHKPLTTKKHKTIVGANAPDGFLNFWGAWPSSPRKGGKSECLRRWLARGLEDSAAAIVAHVGAMKSGTQWSDPQYIPAPLTYLNQARWDGAEDSASENPIYADMGLR